MDAPVRRGSPRRWPFATLLGALALFSAGRSARAASPRESAVNLQDLLGIRHLSQTDSRWWSVGIGNRPNCVYGYQNFDGGDDPSWRTWVCKPKVTCVVGPMCVAEWSAWETPPGQREPVEVSSAMVSGWGCELTSVAMIANAHSWLPRILVGSIPRPGFEVTPVDVQAIANAGKLFSEYRFHLRSGQVGPFTSATGSGQARHLNYRLGSWPDVREEIDRRLAAGEPQILVFQLEESQHAVVAVGWDADGVGGSSYLLLDPGLPVSFFGGRLAERITWAYGTDWESKLRYAVLIDSGDPTWLLELQLHSPLEMLVVAPDGRALGWDPSTATVRSDFPDGFYGQVSGWGTEPGAPDPVKVLQVPDAGPGAYRIVLTATGDGPFRLVARTTAGLVQEYAGVVTQGETLKLVVSQDPSGADSIVRGDNLPPTPPALRSRAVLVGDPVTFDGGDARDLDGSVVSWSWNFGDGGTAQGPATTHAFDAEGLRTVTVTVTDDRGASATAATAVSIFPRAVATGSTELLLHDLFQQPVPDSCGSYHVTMSDDGSVVAFETSSDECSSLPLVTGRSALVDRARQSATWIPGVFPVLSRDGRFLAYASEVDNVAYVRDLATGGEEAVSIGTDGRALATRTFGLSGNGRYFVFTEGQWTSGPVHVRDRATGTTTVVATAAGPGALAISADGRIVAYPVANARDSLVSTLRLLDRSTGSATTCFADLGLSCSGLWSMSDDGRYVTILGWDTTVYDHRAFVFDRQTGTKERVGVSTAGVIADEGELSANVDPVISGDGRFVVFNSRASNLVPGILNADIHRAYLRDRANGTTEAVALAPDGSLPPPAWSTPGAHHSEAHAVSAGGRFVLFLSAAVGLTDPAPSQVGERAYLYVRDRAGTPPQAAPVADASGPYLGWVSEAGSATVTFDASRSLSRTGAPLTATWTFGDGSPDASALASVSVAHAYAAAGTYTATLVVNDGSRSSAPATALVTVLPPATAPTLAAPPCGTAGGQADLVLTRQRLAAPASGWDVGRDGPAPSVSDVWAPGSLLVEVTGPDGLLPDLAATVVALSRTSGLEYATRATLTVPGHWAAGSYRLAHGGASAVVTVPCPVPDAVRLAPRANVGGPYAGTAGAPIRLDGGRSTDPQGLSLEYVWDLGDGTTTVGSTIEHTYASPGTYVVTLQVWNGTLTSRCGTGESCSTTVVVQPPATPGPAPEGPAAPTPGGGGCGCGAGTDAGAWALLLLVSWRSARRRSPVASPAPG